MEKLSLKNLKIVDQNFVPQPSILQLKLAALEAVNETLSSANASLKIQADFANEMFKDACDCILVWIAKDAKMPDHMVGVVSYEAGTKDLAFFRTKFGQGRWRNLLSDDQVLNALQYLVSLGKLEQGLKVYTKHNNPNRKQRKPIVIWRII